MNKLALMALLASALAGCADMPFHDEASGTFASGDAHSRMQADNWIQKTGR